MRNPFVIALLVSLAAASASSRAYAQGADVFGSPEGGDTGENALESDEGLQSATPTDSVNELNSGNGSLDGGNGNGFQVPAEDDFDGGGNQLFDDSDPQANEPVPAMPGAFDSPDGQDPGATNPAQATPAPVQTVNPTLSNQAPVQTAPVQTAPVQTAPIQTAPAGNAQMLMNQISTEPMAPATDAPVALPGESVPETSTATGTETTLPAVSPPAIEAPPLPPPNEFAGAPPVPGSMRLMADGEAPEEYRVLPGDTLFDICDQLLDEPAYWPKLWALNPEIKNPHFIFPNMRLRFYPGDDDTPPYLQVVTEDDVIPIDKGELDEQLLVAEKVNFVTDIIEDEAPIEVIGPEDVGGEDLTDELLVSGRVYSGSDMQLQVPGFIYSEEREPLGVVIGGRDGSINLSSGMQALIEEGSGLAAGSTYTVLRRADDVVNPEGDHVGYRYYFVANIRIDRGLEDDIYVGTIRDMLLGTKEDDIVVNFISTYRTAPSGEGYGALSSVDTSIVGFEYLGQEVGGAGGYAFLDKGNGDGVSPGMYLPIYATPGPALGEFARFDQPDDHQMIGVMRVIDTTEAGAVAYIVRNTEEVRIGNRAAKGG